MKTDHAHDRRHFFRRAAATGVGFAALQSAFASRAFAPGSSGAAPAGYGPLVPDPSGILDLPKGFSYQIISRTGERMSDGLLLPGKPDGMAAFPGPQGRTIVVRNHEMEPQWRDSAFGPRGELTNRIPFNSIYDRGHGMPLAGGTTTIVYDTRGGSEPGIVEQQFLSLAGTERNCAGGPTPRNSWITCEETVATTDDRHEKDHGFCFEVPATADQRLASPEPIVGMGRFNHEACATDANTGIVYQTEDRHDGLIYRYIPENPAVLTEGGKLQALAVVGRKALDTRNWDGNTAVRPGERLACEWIDVEDHLSPDDSLRFQGFKNGAARFARGEGMWTGVDAHTGQTVIYFCCTNGGPARCGQIWAYRPSPFEASGGEADRPGTLSLFVESPEKSVLEYADNVTIAPSGDLVVCEDGSGEQFLVGITPDARLYKLARNAHNNSEFAGACFSPEGSVMFVNIQHSPGMTLAVRGPFRR